MGTSLEHDPEAPFLVACDVSAWGPVPEYTFRYSDGTEFKTRDPAEVERRKLAASSLDN